MSLVLLLTLDPGLEREVEKALDDTRVLCLGSADEIATTVHHLDSSFVLIVDTASYAPPSCPEADHVICVGDEIQPGYLLLERPVRRKELMSLLGLPAGGTVGAAGPEHGVPSPLAEFQRDAVHDLKNQLTTLQGNLLLLKEELEDEAVEDMVVAAEKAVSLSGWLELLGKGDFGTQHIELADMLNALTYFFHRLRDRETQFVVVCESGKADIHKDPRKLLVLLLLLVQHLPGHPENCNLTVSPQQEGVRLHATWGDTAFIKPLPKPVSDLASKMGGTLTCSDLSWTLIF